MRNILGIFWTRKKRNSRDEVHFSFGNKTFVRSVLYTRLFGEKLKKKKRNNNHLIGKIV